MAIGEETFYRDQILSNAAVIFPTSFRIVLRSNKNEGRDMFTALLLEGETHKLLLSGQPAFQIHEALFTLLGETSKEISKFLESRAAREAEAEGHEAREGAIPRERGTKF